MIMINSDMPDNCVECRLSVWDLEEYVCPFSGIPALNVGRQADCPLIEPEQRWIPCEERLPEKNGVYIVSYEDAVTWLEWFNGKWFFYPSNPAREETGTIYAWMPLPEPYER